MRISLIQPTELGLSEIQAWHTMQLKTGSLVNPFLCPEFSLGVGKVQSAARVAVLTEGSEIAGFFPFERRRFGTGAAIGAVFNNCQGLIHGPGVEWDARELLKACKLSTWQFNKLAQDQAPFERYAGSHIPAAIIDLTHGFEAYREGFQLRSSKFLKRLDRKIRNLEKEFGDTHLVADSRDIGDLRTFMLWKSEQCRRNGWLDIFDRPWVVELIDYLFATRSDSFSSVLSMLYVGETPAAGQLCLRSGGFLAGWYTAYNPKFGNYSPGLIQFIRATEELAAAGVQTFELGGGDFYQEKLKNGDIYYSNGTVTTGRFAAGVHRAQACSEDWARHQIKRYPLAYRAADGVLRRMGRIA